MAIAPGGFPVLPNELRELRDYLGGRDGGFLTTGPTPVALEQTVLGGGLTYDLLSWNYAPPLPLQGLEADGFVVWWENADTDDPTHGGVILSRLSFAYGMIWPGVTRSYAMQAWRMTHRGPIMSAKVQLDDWKGVT